MNLIDKIISRENLNNAYLQVKKNKGSAGIDKITVEEASQYLKEHKQVIITSILERRYKPQPVRRVYIPKDNGKTRPLGIPNVVDRVIQQAIAQQLTPIFEEVFSENSFGFRPGRDCHKAISKSLEYLNAGYEWVIDIDIEKFFDKVNQDKLISILREQVNDAQTLSLIRAFLKSGVMENGVISPTKEGVPQGGPLSPLLANIYLDKLDKELESRGLRFARYADDVNIFVKSELAANRVMKSITSWIERKLFLKVNATKSKVVRPQDSKFLGFTYLKKGPKWEVKPTKDKLTKFSHKIRDYLKRNRASARPLAETFRKLNQMIKGWINYFKIGMMKTFIRKFGEWLRHKVRVIIIKQWKKPRTVYNNLMALNKKYKNGFDHESIYKVANARLGLYKRCSMNVVNFILNPTILENTKGDRPGLVNPLKYYSK